jgi:outer membrane lipoprotein SlyB
MVWCPDKKSVTTNLSILPSLPPITTRSVAMKLRFLTALLASSFLLAQLSGCASRSQNTYDAKEVGKTTSVSFGTVLSVRNIQIRGENTGAGAVLGGATGAGLGNLMGKGTGKGWTTGAGLVAGLAAGALAEQAMADRDGLEYTITLETGNTIVVTQESKEGERVMAAGDRVMVQTTGAYQRVLLANNLPTEIKRPAGVKVVD